MSTVIIVSELLKIALTGYFTMAKQAGLSEEETLKVYQDSKKEFDANNPADLADV